MKKVGEYSVTSIDFNTWLGAETPKVVQKNKKQKTKKKIVYQLFVDFASISTDIFWTKKFNLWASGKLPKFFSLNDNVLSYNKNTSIECVFDQDLSTNMKNCMEFFKTYGGIYSKNDEKIIEDEELSSDFTSELTEPEPKNWSQFDKKTQELLLKIYTNDLTSVLNLTNKESNLLLQTLRLAVSAKNFNKNNISIEEGKIINIKGLMHDKENKLFKIDYNISHIKTVSKKKDSEESTEDDSYISELTKDMIPQFTQKFNKYYELYDKKYKKYQ